MIKWFLIVSGIALVLAQPSDAALRLRIEDVGSGVGLVITDNLPGDLNANPGVIVFSGSVIGNFVVNVTTGFSKPALPLVGTTISGLGPNSVNVFSTVGGTFRVTLEDDGFTSGPLGTLSLLAAIGGTLSPGATITAQSWVNPVNSVPALGPDGLAGLPIGSTPVGSIAGFIPAFFASSPAFSRTGTTTFNHSGPYALFSQVTITVPSGGGSVGFDYRQQVTVSPFNGTGTPGEANCDGRVASALAQKYGGLANAAAALGYGSLAALQNAIAGFCGS